MQRQVSVGPESVAFRFTTEALCFGGEQCTLTDVAMAAGVAPTNVGHSSDGVKSIASDVVYSAMREVRRKLENAIDSMKVTIDNNMVSDFAQDMPLPAHLTLGLGMTLIGYRLRKAQ